MITPARRGSACANRRQSVIEFQKKESVNYHIHALFFRDSAACGEAFAWRGANAKRQAEAEPLSGWQSTRLRGLLDRLLRRLLLRVEHPFRHGFQVPHQAQRAHE